MQQHLEFELNVDASDAMCLGVTSRSSLGIAVSSSVAAQHNVVVGRLANRLLIC